jgi:hypothetical protein
MVYLDLWRVVRRRWWVLLLGMLITVTGCYAVQRTPGVYWAYTRVIFLPPVAPGQENPIAPDSSSLIPLAGIIQDEIYKGSPPLGSNGQDVTLVDQGVYDGWSVRLPNSGGQWATNYAEPVLIVQASGPSAQVVQTRMYDLFDEITRLVADHEDADGVSTTSRVDFTLSPAAVAVQYSNGHRSRALAIIVLVGVGLSLAACIVADRVLPTRRRRGETNDGIGDARVRNAAGGDQDGAGGEGAGAPSRDASDRGGDRTASRDARPGQPGVRDRARS